MMGGGGGSAAGLVFPLFLVIAAPFILVRVYRWYQPQETRARRLKLTVIVPAVLYVLYGAAFWTIGRSESGQAFLLLLGVAAPLLLLAVRQWRRFRVKRRMKNVIGF